ncbi:MAG: succinate dehydrogenase, cytochrome b556 subunit [Pseudomonadota bacterium]
MNKKRPVNLDLTTIKFPITAIVSILHRLSGVILFLLIPLVIWMLHTSLASPLGFKQIGIYMQNPIMKIVIWGLLAGYFYHLLAGIRHLFMDLQFAETLQGGKATAWLVILVALILIVLTGLWLWFEI